jgi:hypothetical protein
MILSKKKPSFNNWATAGALRIQQSNVIPAKCRLATPDEVREAFDVATPAGISARAAMQPTFGKIELHILTSMGVTNPQGIPITQPFNVTAIIRSDGKRLPMIEAHFAD